MNIRVGFVPYLNMVPFYEGFGPAPIDMEGRSYEFWERSPRMMGRDAEEGLIDAGPFSLVDALKMSTQYEPVGNFGMGVRRQAQSVLLFSKEDMPSITGTIAVTDHTSTSILLLQVLMEQRFNQPDVQYGRIASIDLFDGEASAVLLIGDEALNTRKEGLQGFPVVTDLGEEWFRWQHVPFVFARWMVRRALPQDVKDYLELALDKSLKTLDIFPEPLYHRESINRGLTFAEIRNYWNGFIYRLNPSHESSIALFTEQIKKQCLIV